MLPPMLQMDPLPNPIEAENIYLNETVTDNLRKYLNKQCLEGCKSSHCLMFEGSQDKKNVKKMNIAQFVGNSTHKDKEATTLY